MDASVGGQWRMCGSGKRRVFNRDSDIVDDLGRWRNGNGEES